MGLVLVLAKWTSGLSPSLEPVKQLTGSGKFNWGPDQEASLCKVRKMVKSLLPLSPFMAGLVT